MRRSPASRTRNRGLLVAAVASLGLALVADVASALLPYSVHVRVVPTPVAKGSDLRVIANGNSSNTSILVVFLDRQACATTATDERGHPATEIIDHAVVGLYKRSRTVLARVAGSHYACAYLIATPPGTLTRGYASAAYAVSL